MRKCFFFLTGFFLLAAPAGMAQSSGSSGDEITITLSDLPSGAKPLTLVRIPAGTFLMGSDDGSEWSWCYPCEHMHEVTISKDFYMGKYEITVGQYAAFLKSTGDESGVDWDDPLCPLKREGGDYVLKKNIFGKSWDQPMVEINWFGAKAFADWLTKTQGITFRLPTEAQWEYACRAGSTTRYCYGDSGGAPNGCYSKELDEYAWWCGNNKPYGTKEVGKLLPNDFGLYDMHGNVWEWCQDWWDEDYYLNSPSVDPQGPASGSSRVLRGGGWASVSRYCRSACRSWSNPDLTFYGPFGGFRIVRNQ